MSGETDLQKLLKGLKPKLNEGEFVFCTLPSSQNTDTLDPLCLFDEEEGTTVIIPKQQADDAALTYSSVFAWITLTVHSSLEAVGLTAAVSSALAKENISSNMVAAYYHDHLFVPKQVAEKAIKILERSSEL